MFIGTKQRCRRKVIRLKEEYIRLSPSERLHEVDIPIIGLTGGIATGKSTVSKMLIEQGIPLIDADKLVKKIYTLPETVEFIRLEFPAAVQNESIDFKTLRKLAFSETSIREKIETFIYKRMPDAFHEELDKLKPIDFLVYDVPLLFEKQLDQKMDVHLLVYSPRETQIERLMARDGINEDLANEILKNQLPIDDKIKLSDKVIQNVSDLATLESETNNIFGELLCE